MRFMPIVAALVGTLLSVEVGLAEETVGGPAARGSAPITLRTRIPLPGVYGRMDHYGWDSRRGQLLVAALGNDTVEIIGDWRRRHTITGLEHPQAAVYVPGADRIAVSDQSGKVRFYDASSYEFLRSVDFGEYANADNMRYDTRSKLLYVGYGSGSRGAIATIDPATMERRTEYKLGSHPESFQLETNGSRLFVNLPDQSSVGVIDLGSGAVTRWKIPGHSNVHAMAFDEANQRLFTAALQPGRFSVIDARSGAVVATLPCVQGVDDLWFDADRRRIYAPGSGAIDMFEEVDPDRYAAVAHVVVDAGAGSTSLHLKSRTQNALYMSLPNLLPQGGSEVLLFYLND
jgi:DNA-binding beta-propeller fold protein YncE